MINHWEILVLIFFVVVLFGSARLPKLMRDVGKSVTELKKGMRGDFDETESANKDNKVE